METVVQMNFLYFRVIFSSYRTTHFRTNVAVWYHPSCSTTHNNTVFLRYYQHTSGNFVCPALTINLVWSATRQVDLLSGHISFQGVAVFVFYCLYNSNIRTALWRILHGQPLNPKSMSSASNQKKKKPTKSIRKTMARKISIVKFHVRHLDLMQITDLLIFSIAWLSYFSYDE